MNEDHIRELFREMRDEPVPADSQTRVRMAVAERTQTWHERLRRHWKIATAVLVPACVVLVAMLARQPARIPVPAVPSAVPSAVPPVALPMTAQNPEPVAPQTPVVVSRPRVVRARHQVVEKVRPPQEATLIRIDTPDPDVVILLIGG